MSLENSKSTGRTLWSQIMTRQFIVVVILLAFAAVLAGPVASWKDFKTHKEPLPLKKLLRDLDVDALMPYRVTARHIMESSVVVALGTEHYINWVLEDTEVAEDDPLRRPRLLVTYYTGGSDLVPHTPDVCYLGSGYRPEQQHETKIVDVGTLTEQDHEVPLRICSFVKTGIQDHAVTSVAYTFYCNGRFAADRLSVRLLTHDPRRTYAYFSKVEVSFGAHATREQTIEGARKLFEVLLPLLIEEHWPDFEAAERAADDK